MTQCDFRSLAQQLRRIAGAGFVLLMGQAAWAAPGTAIFTCTDANGKKLTSDRPIAECSTREQRVLNADGSVRNVLGPTLTADERADKEARDREAAAVVATRQDAVRRDRNLIARFPDEAAHRKARNSALDSMRNAVRLSEARLELLAKERKPLMDEAEFYTSRTMPAPLRAQIEGNETTTEAQRALIQNQQIEVLRINKLYDAELERLKKLWRGAPPGTLGPLPVGDADPAASK
jgi:type I site-specific restriction endonuclease